MSTWRPCLQRHGLIYHRAETRSNAGTRSPLGDSMPSLTDFGRNPSHLNVVLFFKCIIINDWSPYAESSREVTVNWA
uniref:Uncharacterized protein n=1 Tax=Anguilla anguilla TaxID=7936 RepID=A0A0E9QVH3_ANGAN